MPIGEFMDAIVNLWLQNRNTVTAIGIPNSGVEKSFFDSFLKKCDEKKVYPPVVELKNAFTQTGTSISIRGKKARVTAALQPLFEQGKYFIHPDHIEARDELLTIGSSRWDDVCLVGGTKIATIFGNKNIEDIKVGDYVITPQGLQKVTASGCTGIYPFIEKFGIKATPNHKVFSFNKGIISIDTLSYGDIISKLNLKEVVEWKYRRLLLSMVKSMPLWVERENITSLGQETIKNGSVLKDFTLRFGNFIINKKFLKAMSFTIKTGTLLITTFLILSHYHLMNTIESVKTTTANLCKNTWKRLDHWLRFGINLQRVEVGIEKTLLLITEKLLTKLLFVKYAIESSGLNIQIPLCVRLPVIRKMAETVVDGMKQGNALSAAIIFSQINTEKLEPALRSADINTSTKLGNPTEFSRVYNITVENEGVYYANGVLVSNCDTMAYAEQILTPAFEEKVEENDYIREQKHHSNYGLE